MHRAIRVPRTTSFKIQIEFSKLDFLQVAFLLSVAPFSLSRSRKLTSVENRRPTLRQVNYDWRITATYFAD